MTGANTLIDNSEGFKLVDTLKNILAEENIKNIDIATGYWDIPGTELLVNELDSFLQRDGTKFRLLIGKDPFLFAQYNKNPKYVDLRNWPEEFIRTDINQIELKPEYEKVVEFLLKYLGDDKKMEIHIFDRNEKDEVQFLHSKCYIFYGPGIGRGIIGSSNFTYKGLVGNAELNFLETTPQVIEAKPGEVNRSKGHILWFNEKWNLSKDWSKEFLEQVLRPSKIAKSVQQKNELKQQSQKLTPYENYIKILQDKFGMITDSSFKSVLQSYLPREFSVLEYQLNAVQQCYAFMLQHNGFALGDVVGLGKTVVGILLIKYFIETSQKLEKSDKVLIIVPPAIKSSWEDTIKKFDENQSDKISEHVKFLTTGSVVKISDFSEEEISDAEDALENDDDDDFNLSAEEKNENLTDFFSDKTNEIFGLVVIDESHKFRNKNTRMYQALMEYFENVNKKSGWYPYVGLISATIQNNSPRDIQNQINLFEHSPGNSSFEKVEGCDLDKFFTNVNQRYSFLIHSENHGEKNETKQKLIELSKEIREKVLSDILVRRTRTDIKNNKNYKNSLIFPSVHEPEPLYYEMDEKLAKLFFDTMKIIAPEIDESDAKNPDEGLGYHRYRATMYLNEKDQKKYSGRNMTAKRSSSQLARIMQILLVKRLESSFKAFKESLGNFYRYNENMIKMWEHDSIFICPQIEVNKELDVEAKQKNNPDKKITIEDCFDDIRKKIKKLNADGKNKKNQNAEYTRAQFVCSDQKQSYIDFVKSDLEKIKKLLDRWKDDNYDPKLEKFKDMLREPTGFFDRGKNTSHKLVIFSEAISTVKSLSDWVKHKTGKNPLVITAANRDKMQEEIKKNFDANYENQIPWDSPESYNVIITTEVLAEGINLHRANTILNYDTPWNATRLIQRIGRVNRIGSPNKDIYIYNFYPSAQGDEQINLVKNAYTKLQSFHTTFGEDAKIFSQAEELSKGNFEAAVNGEESVQEKYISELKKYKEENPQRFEFIEKLEKAEQKSVVPVNQDEKGNSYFAIKRKNNFGCIYVKVDPQLNSRVISFSEMFDEFRQNENMQEKSFPKNREQADEAAIREVNVYQNKQFKAKSKSKEITEILKKAYDWTAREDLPLESKSLIGSAMKAIKNGNFTLAKRLNNVLSELSKKEEMLIPLSSEEVAVMMKNELSNISASTNARKGEAYIYGGFYF
jgi:superfamily II DNA/RNA helicase